MWYQPFHFLVLYEKLVVLLQGKYSEFWRTERKISSSSCLPWKTKQSCAMLQWNFQNSKFYQNVRVTSITMTSLVICPTLFLFFFPLFSLFMERSSLWLVQNCLMRFKYDWFLARDSSHVQFSLLCLWPQISFEWSHDFLRSGLGSRSLFPHVKFKPVLRHRSLAAAVFGKHFLNLKFKRKTFPLVLPLSLWDILHIVKFIYY